MKKNIYRIVNIGKTPPPIGGVAYFVKRLLPYLDEAGIENIMYDISGQNTEEKEKEGIICCSLIKAFIKVFFGKRTLVVFHSTRPICLLGAFLFRLRHKVVCFVHGEAILFQNSKIESVLLRRLNNIVVPIPELKEKLCKMNPKLEKKIICMPYILFPRHIEQIKNTSMCELREKYQYILAAYAYDNIFYQGIDLYGIDMLIELMHQLKEAGMNAAMILILPCHSQAEYYTELLDRIEKYNIQDRIYIHNGNIAEASDLYAMADIYVRPTCTDGDSFSIWEAMYVKTPVVVSDAVARPKGAVLFKNRDNEDFFNTVMSVLEHYEDYKFAAEEQNIEGSEKILLEYFKRECNIE